MADTWEIDDPSDNGDEGGWMSGVTAIATGIADAVGKGASNGFAQGDAASGMAGGPAQAEAAREGISGKLAAVGNLPGAGSLWTLDGGRLTVTPRGWLVIGAAGVGLWLMLGGSGKRGRR